ncbi:hypothetical protein E1B28_009488 [Marasmius oreades]|uniref:Uncharacterized protein n=1 Tax=Marasmius oreades TaxID=181124 RepID=A0A9P7RVT9_9AGAR|nr:uncharacterized protein E1B28_009488 [Marasmius oreades]KAG7090368.1 hypothetical protein E1B28_009488 [Marasmius oreades]
MSDTPHELDHNRLWKDGKHFAQISTSQPLPSEEECQGKSLLEVVHAVATRLVGASYGLGHPPMKLENRNGPGLEVFDALTQILPQLSPQSVFYWNRSARGLASFLESAKYPIRAQASHLVFWWARLGGLNGLPTLGQTKATRTMWVRDGSNTELSWVIPVQTSPSDEGNRHVRFAIDPFHPETGLRLAGGAVIDWLWSVEGSLGLVDNQEGTKEWKDIIEKWLFPNMKSSGEVVPLCHYAVAFDLEPSGRIQLKSYYVPPRRSIDPSAPKPPAQLMIENPETLTPVETLIPLLDPSLKEPFHVLCQYLADEGVEKSGLRFLAIACDVTTADQNRLKLYMWPTIQHSLNDTIRHLTLGGRINGPGVEDAITTLRKLYRQLFPQNTDNAKMVPRDGGIGGLSFYYELMVGEKFPASKAYFDMSNYGESDLETTKAVERFFADVRKPNSEPGWYTSSIARANPHRPLGTRSGAQTGVTFGMKRAEWQVMGYMSTEVFAPEREDDEVGYTHDELIKEFYKVYLA